MLCLVTGVAGFVGSHLAERLLDDGHDVRGVDCFTDYYARSLKEDNLRTLRAHPRFRFVEADLGAAPLDSLVEETAWVFHQAAQAGVRASWGKSFEAYTHHNVLATQRLFEALKARTDNALRKVVYASSSSVYGNTPDRPMRESSLPRPFSPYGVTKLAAEHLAELYRENFGLPTVSLRYFTVYGPRQRPDMGFRKFVELARAGEAIPVFGDGEQTRDFTFVGDIVQANLEAAAREAVGVFNVGGGSEVTLNEVLQTLERCLGAPLRRDERPPVPGDVRHTAADTSKARRELGYAPKTSLEEGLSALVQWYDEHLVTRKLTARDRGGL